MQASPEQMAFPFASLDFAGWSLLSLDQIAKKLRCSTDHLLNEIDHGALSALDLKGAKATRRNAKIEIAEYRRYVLAHMTGPFRADFIRDLPRPVLEQLAAEIRAALAGK